MHKQLLSLQFLLLFIIPGFISAGITGKVAGRVTDAESKDPLVGINVVVTGTAFGAATDIDGYYSINNIPPGNYTIIVSGIGYQKKQFVNVKVAADFTYKLDVQLSGTVTTLETIVITADAPMIRKDLTSSQTSVDATQIATLPVEEIDQILTLQAGIVQGAGGELHIKGGRSTEIAYTVNGISISNPFDNSRSVQISTNAIQELSVVSGTFNAEYGNALSGIVNTITKEGGSAYKGFLSFYTGDQISNRKDVFFNIKKLNPMNNFVVEGTVGGPIPFLENNLSFFASGRYNNNQGYLYGIREHTPYDSVYKNPRNPNDIRVSKNGDDAIVTMNPSKDYNLTGKITFKPIPSIKINYDALYTNSYYKDYDHDLKYNPDAEYNNYEWGLLNSIEIRHAIDNRTFYTLKGSYNLNDYKQYLYPLLDASGNEVKYYAGMDIESYHADPRYQPDYKSNRVANYTFLSGGTSNDQYYQRSGTFAAKFDITSQINKSHELKFGADYKAHKLDFENFTVMRDSTQYKTPTILSTSTAYHERYTKKPNEFSLYMQDKMEFENLILNIGLRYDYFEAGSEYSTNTFYPSPNNPSLPATVDKSSLLAMSEAKKQFSPRIGISFPITDKGIIHFSYGHFFQIPPFQYLYSNPSFKYSFASGTPVFGNADLNPEKTVTYELGLQQQFTENLAINITGFFKDVRDLLALQQIRTSSSETYLKYVNKDYASIKGVTFSLTKRKTTDEIWGVTLDYTFQVSEGNETGSDAFFLDLLSGRQSEKLPVFLGWDQTHTLNTSVSVGKADWNVTLVGRLGTGLPYTPQITSQQIYLRTNSGRRPAQATVDLLAEKSFSFLDAGFTFFLKVFNLFDTLNERLIYDDTGRATYTLELNRGTAQKTNDIAGNIAGVHSASEYFVQPAYYMPPREVRIGMSVEF